MLGEKYVSKYLFNYCFFGYNSVTPKINRPELYARNYSGQFLKLTWENYQSRIQESFQAPNRISYRRS